MSGRQVKPKNLLIIGALFLLVQCAENKPSDDTIEAIFTAESPIIDGLENDLIWQQITPVVLKENRSGNEVLESRLKTHFKACYDDSNLYFFFVCNDIRISGHLLRKGMNIYGRTRQWKFLSMLMMYLKPI